MREEDYLWNLGLKMSITGEGVWRIRRGEKSSMIELFKYEETGYGDILSREFVEWRGRKMDSKSPDLASPGIANETPANNVV